MQRTTSGIRQGALILLEYPFTDLVGRKRRPALVVSNDAYNASHEDCVAVALTSVLKHDPWGVPLTVEDLTAGTLLRPSRILTDKIFTVEQQLATMIGMVTQEKLKAVQMKILEIF